MMSAPIAVDYFLKGTENAMTTYSQQQQLIFVKAYLKIGEEAEVEDDEEEELKQFFFFLPTNSC